MRFTFFSLNRLSFFGGAEKYIIEVSKALKRRGNGVFYIGDCRPILSFNIFAGFFLGIVSFKKSLKELFNLNKYLSITPESQKSIDFIKLRLSALLPFSSERKKIKEYFGNSNLILVKNEILDMVVFYLLGPFAKRSKTALLIFSSLSYPSKTFRGKVHNFFYTGFLYKFLAKKYDFMIVSNKADIDFLNKTFEIDPSKIKHIPYGLNEEYFAKKDELICSSKFSILFAGRMEEQKGIYFLKDIIDRINLGKTELTGNIIFNIAGNGPLEEVVKHLGKRYKNVNYLGQLGQKELRNLYLSSDLSIITSKWETFSYVCLEAQACGLPVVAFDVPGPSDIIRGHTGKLITLGDVQSFIDAIFYYFRKKNTNFKDNLVNRCSIASESKKIYNINKTASLLEHIYTDFI